MPRISLLSIRSDFACWVVTTKVAPISSTFSRSFETLLRKFSLLPSKYLLCPWDGYEVSRFLYKLSRNATVIERARIPIRSLTNHDGLLERRRGVSLMPS
jgi:hypothetical protein